MVKVKTRTFGVRITGKRWMPIAKAMKGSGMANLALQITQFRHVKIGAAVLEMAGGTGEVLIGLWPRYAG